MGLMAFILDLAELCIWPITIITCLLIVRAPLGLLIPFAQSIKYKDFELQFSQELNQVSDQAQQVLHVEVSTAPSLDQLLQHANHLPNHSIFQAWSSLETCCRNLLLEHKPNIIIPDDRPYKFVGEALTREKIISEKHAKLFHELRQLRNKVSHAPNFEVNSVLAKQYIEVCFALIDELSDLNTTKLKYAHH